MKIALCSKGNFSLEKGFTKNRIELAEGLIKLGWESVFVDKNKLGIPSEEKYNAKRHSLALKEFLLTNGDMFDVVLYEYDTLPFNRRIFSPKTLFVARPAILEYHFPLINFRYNTKTIIHNLIKDFLGYMKINKKKRLSKLDRIDYCLYQSDLIQVQNKKDRDILLEKGFGENRIIIIPNGISEERIIKFEKKIKEESEPDTVVYVGTFDFRKGAIDFPIIFKQLKKRFPEIRLKLLGTHGMFASIADVLKFFPKSLRSDIEVVPKFTANELPGLLKDCNIGIFPSYLESFGFGALEMMCAGMPVVAYDAPGPSDFILPGLLVPTGDRTALANKTIALLEDRNLLEIKGKEAREIAINRYCWDDIAMQADYYYRHHLGLLRGEPAGKLMVV